jgi:hypothetical protein
MASHQDDDRNSLEPKVKTEHPDPKAAGRKPEGGEDRPGFDLGGSSEEGRKGPTNTIPGGPLTSPSGGVASGGAGGGSDAGGGPTAGSGGPRI